MFTTGMIILNGSFSSLLGVVNVLNCFNLLVVIAASLRLRFAYPDLPRPYKFSAGNFSTIVLLTPVICTTTLVLFSTLYFDSRSAFVSVIIISVLLLATFAMNLRESDQSPTHEPLIAGRKNSSTKGDKRERARSTSV